MRIACPSCGAEYDVPDRLLAGPARSLRCSRCGADFALPEAPAAAPPAPPPMPAPAPPVEPAVAPAAAVPEAASAHSRSPLAQSARGDAWLPWAWAASIAVVGGGLAAMVAFRAAVMAAWPPATHLFTMLGLA